MSESDPGDSLQYITNGDGSTDDEEALGIEQASKIVDVPGLIREYVQAREKYDRETWSYSVDAGAFESLPRELFDGAAAMQVNGEKGPGEWTVSKFALTDIQKEQLKDLGGAAAEVVIETIDEAYRSFHTR